VCLSSLGVSCVAFKPDNPNILFSGSLDKTIKMWDITSGSILSTLRCGSRVNNIALKDNIIAAGCGDGTIRIFKLNQSQDLAEIQSEPPLSCGSRVLTVALKDNMIVAGCLDGTIRIFKLNQSPDLAETQSEPPLRGHSGWVSGMAFSADGQWLISGSRDKTLRLWDTRPGGTVVSAV